MENVRDNAHEEVQQILALLDLKLQGSEVRIGEVETAIGRYSGFFRDLRRPSRRGSIRVVDLMATLDHLAIEPPAFFAEALGSCSGVPQATTLRGAPPALVVRARERWELELPGSLGRSYLEELDSLRHRDPKRAVRLIEEAVDFVVPEDIPRLLGIAGSAWRLSFHLDEAEHAIQAGLEVARKAGDLVAEGDLLQRSGYIFADRGDSHRALEVAREAAATHLLVDNLPGAGRALVDQGIFNVYLDRPRVAIAAYRSALKHLVEDDLRNRISAFQGLGVAHELLGELEEASVALDDALALGHGMEDFYRGKVCWLQGSLALRLGRQQQAEGAFRQAIDAFQNIQPVDTALVTIELVRLQLLKGKPEEAYETATSMLKLLEPLRQEKNRFISAAIADLLRHGRSGFSLILVEQVARQIQKEREHDLCPRPGLI
jgi:tetratricopeptide (TPR) repeat protein